MGKLYQGYLRLIVWPQTEQTIPSLKMKNRELTITAMSVCSRQSGKLLTRTEFYAELKRMTAKETDPAIISNTRENWSVFLVKSQIGGNKIGAIKALRETIPGLGLREAKDMIEFVGSYSDERAIVGCLTEAKARVVCERFNAVGTIPVMRERA